MEGVSETELFLGDGLDVVASKVATHTTLTCPEFAPTPLPNLGFSLSE